MARRGWRARADGTWLLLVYIVLLLFLPSRLVVGPVGSAGTPANIVALGGLGLWVLGRAVDVDRSPTRRHPVRVAYALFTLAVLLSYVVAMSRPIRSEELSTANTGLILVASWLAVIVVAEDLAPSTRRIERIVGVLSVTGGAVAVLCIVQFATGRPLTDYIQIPGLVTNNSLSTLLARGGYVRPSGTALHPIELGVTLCMVLPLAVHRAANLLQTKPVSGMWPVAAILVAIPLSISRSAITGLAVVLLVLLPTWSWRMRITGVTAVLAVGGAMFVAVPGMLGTLTKLFSGATNDPSATSRTDSYPLAFAFIERSPVLGRGFQTFLPEYRILDNQYLGLLIELGIMGTLCFLGVLVTGLVAGISTYRRSHDSQVRSQAIALSAMVAVPLVCMAFIDGLSFPLLSGLTFLGVGLLGTVCRIEEAERLPAPRHDRAARRTEVLRSPA